MSDWFSSKLKAAESILQKIDQQAAESLRKDEEHRSDDLYVDKLTKSGGTVPLKDQFKKRTQENSGGPGGRLSSDSENGRSVHNKGSKEVASTSDSTIRKSAVNDGDWTELLGSPTQPIPSSPVSLNRVASASAGARSYSRRLGSAAGSNFMVPELRRSPRSDNKVAKSNAKPRTPRNTNINGIPSDGEESSLSDSVRSSSKLSVADHKKFVKNQESVRKEMGMQDHMEDVEVNLEHQLPGDVSQSMSNDGSAKTVLAAGAVDDTVPGLNLGVNSGHTEIEGSRARSEERSILIRKNIHDVNGVRSGSDAGSDSELESGSSSDSDSEDEHQREERKRRREKILAEKVAAKALEAVRERENMVARLEGEKQSLVKIIEERAKQQAKEASELQDIMIETMEAVDQEKQKHNNTRMEAFARLAKLEIANADLAKSLAAAQWNLEIEAKKVVELRQQIELKESAHQELKRRISSTQQTDTSANHLAVAKGFEVEKELLEAEYATVHDKVSQLQEKARSLEKNIEMTRKEIEEPTEVETELKRRLQQLTDHLIQKQAQVEALSSEKATLQFRIEAVSRQMEENKLSMNMNDFSSISLRDVESGTWVHLDSKTRTSLKEKFRSGKEQFGSLLRQLDAIFLSGAVFLRRNPTAKIWACVYLVCLHLWVFYILTSHSRPSDVSGAVISLDSINSSATI